MLLLPLLLSLLGGQTTTTPTAASDGHHEHPFAVPADLLIGAGVSALQTEGAWNEDGKSESVVDCLLHKGVIPFQIAGETHHRAADTYHRFKEDVAMAAKLKLKLYRLSISWARVLPYGDPARPNAKGVQFYHDYIDEILRYNITPLVTLYHFDHPKLLEDMFKGWQGPKMITYFTEYARFIFKEYANKVGMWVTLDEPNVYCSSFPGLLRDAGLLQPRDVDQYRCMRHAILAHASAYRAFQEGSHKGKIGFTTMTLFATPRSTDVLDVYATQVYNEVTVGLMVNSLVHGDYPQVVKDLLGKHLVPFSPAEQSFVKGTVDFIGLNTYMGVSVAYEENATNSGPASIVGIVRDVPFLAIDFALPAFAQIVPEALRDGVLWTWQRYRLPIVVTENGVADTSRMGRRDWHRAAYYSALLRTLISTMRESGAKVIGYSAWSLIDCFEFFGGFQNPFGLVHVDFEGGSLNRSLKDSARFWVELADTGVVPLVLGSAAPSSATRSTSSDSAGLQLLLAALLVVLLQQTPRWSAAWETLA